MGRGKDLSGKKIGTLKIVGDTGKRTKQQRKIYLVKTEDGKYEEFQSNNLNNGAATGYKKSKEGRLKSSESMKRLNKNKDSYLKKRGYNDGTVNWAKDIKKPKNNTSGAKGVSFLPKKSGVRNNDGWRAYIVFKGKQIHLGVFDDKEDAIAARKAAEEKYFKPILEKYNQK